MGAPSFDQIDFINPTSGWLSNVQGTAPSDLLYTTSNGGRTWANVRQTHPSRNGEQLPDLGVVQFLSRSTGYVSGDVDLPHQSTWMTDDGGHSWHRVPVPGEPTYNNGPLSVRHEMVEIPVWRCTTKAQLTVYERVNSRSWQAGPTLRLPRTGSRCSISASIAKDGGTTWAAVTTRTIRVARLTSRRATWQIVAAPTIRTACRASVQATDGRHAWLIVPMRRQTVIYRTSDGGLHWEAVPVPSR
jgi:photosystem II stability/assembly factor-like uncharacterized protein